MTEVTGTLSFEDIGVGIWFLDGEDFHHRLAVNSSTAARFNVGDTVTLELSADTDEKLLDSTMHQNNLVSVHRIVESD